MKKETKFSHFQTITGRFLLVSLSISSKMEAVSYIHVTLNVHYFYDVKWVNWKIKMIVLWHIVKLFFFENHTLKFHFLSHHGYLFFLPGNFQLNFCFCYAGAKIHYFAFCTEKKKIKYHV